MIECTTAEVAELIIASTGTELQALITDQQLSGCHVRGELAQYARRRHPHMNIIIMSGKTVNLCGQYHVLAKALHCRAVARSGPRLKSERASLQRSRAYRTPSVTPQSLRTAAAELPTSSTAFRSVSRSTPSALVQRRTKIFAHVDFAAVRPTTLNEIIHHDASSHRSMQSATRCSDQAIDRPRSCSQTLVGGNRLIRANRSWRLSPCRISWPRWCRGGGARPYLGMPVRFARWPPDSPR